MNDAKMAAVSNISIGASNSKVGAGPYNFVWCGDDVIYAVVERILPVVWQEPELCSRIKYCGVLLVRQRVLLAQVGRPAQKTE
jgi:hypothetical protein